MLATGARIGEVLALRWADVDLAADHPTVTICGTIVFVKGTGFFRQELTRSNAGYRTVVLPRFAVGMLMASELTTADNPHDAIFASRRGTWLSPHNVRRQWLQARADTGLEWVTPHTFRKTVATLIDKEADTDHAAAQLGHGGKEITKKHYIANPALAPDVSDILEQFGGDRATDDPCPTQPRLARAQLPARKVDQLVLPGSADVVCPPTLVILAAQMSLVAHSLTFEVAHDRSVVTMDLVDGPCRHECSLVLGQVGATRLP